MFPQRLRECRKQRGLSLQKLATVFNMSHCTLSKYETGTRRPDTEMLIKLAEYFGVTTDYLLGISDSPYGQLLAVQYSSSKLPPEAQHELDSYVEYLTDKYCRDKK